MKSSWSARINGARSFVSMALIAAACAGCAAVQESGGASGQARGPLNEHCDPADRAFVCGVRNPEDLVRVPGTPWIVASHVNWALSGGSMTFGFGPLAAIRTDTREVHRLFPTPQAAVDWDQQTYPDCSVPPEGLSSRGLNIRPLGREEFRLYVVNHGGRESVEIIDLNVRNRRLQATWRGCLLTPGGARAESVAPLAGDAVAVTLLGGAGPAVWTFARGWTKVEGVDEYDHGIEVSRDGKWLFLALHREPGSVIRVPVGGGAPQAIFQSDFILDNLRWGEDGRLYATGFFSQGLKECFEKPAAVCDIGFVITQIDPNTLATKEVFRTTGMKGAFGAATTALQIGRQLWVGTWFGDRLAILELKP